MPENLTANRVAALIVFREGVTKEQVERMIEKMKDADFVKPREGSVHEFCDAYEMWPTFYIP